MFSDRISQRLHASIPLQSVASCFQTISVRHITFLDHYSQRPLDFRPYYFISRTLHASRPSQSVASCFQTISVSCFEIISVSCLMLSDHHCQKPNDFRSFQSVASCLKVISVSHLTRRGQLTPLNVPSRFRGRSRSV